MNSDLILYLTEFLANLCAVNYLNDKDKTLISKYKIKGSLKYSVYRKYPKLPILRNLIYNSIKPISGLQKSITHLTIGDSFDDDLCGLPEGLVYLKIGNLFNNDLRELPETLQYLELGEGFKQLIIKLPKALKTLKLVNLDVQNIRCNLSELKLIVDGLWDSDFSNNSELKIPKIKRLHIDAVIAGLLEFQEGLIVFKYCN